MNFPKDFVWGASSSSYQIEGAAYEDNKGLSVWDVFCERDGVIKGNHTGEVACDHYHLYKQDVKLMKEIGLKAYRFSITWPRVIPNGIGPINSKGLDFYDRLVDELLSNDIIPYVTLFHWDYPNELYKIGGLLNSDSPKWFAEYVKVVVERLSDRVNHWLTLNEPKWFVYLGHYTGENAPGLKLDLNLVFLAMHNALLSHGMGVRAIRNYSKQPCEVGFAPDPTIYIPYTNSKEDIEAAKKHMFSVTDLFSNGLWSDPIYFGKYSDEVFDVYGKYMPNIKQDDLKIISQPLDFFGLNHYSAERIQADSNGNPTVVPPPLGAPKSSLDWDVTPESLYWGPKFFYERYKLPIIITENGMSNLDWVSLDGAVHDTQRIDYLHRYLIECKRAMNEGVAIKGHFAWSVTDNFEWVGGYDKRFGLIYVDFETQKRTIKDSGYWYRKVIESNGSII
jgi:beta-glucosidase